MVVRVKKYLQEVRNELRRVVWPDRQQTLVFTLVVIISVLFVALLIWAIDWVLGGILNLILGL